LNRTVVVTGATGDAGRAVCEALVAEGATVVAVGSDAGRLESVAAEARLVCDLTDFAATAALASRIHTEIGPVDGLVHLVGGWRGGHEPDDWEWLEPRILTTLRSTTLAFHDDLNASDAGRAVIIGSSSAAKPTWSGANYATLKSAADSWMSALASGWRKAGTAAAVTLVVTSIGENGTPVEAIARAITPLWDQSAADLNGTHIAL
jgi:NAD(P)-dependent dehydrogenase (short-subunit alcohol dehydrogenase family)